MIDFSRKDLAHAADELPIISISKQTPTQPSNIHKAAFIPPTDKSSLAFFQLEQAGKRI